MSLGEVPGAKEDGNHDCNDAHPEQGAFVITACGGRINYSADTPCDLFRGETVYFCLPICKTDYQNDPLTSCLASRLLNFNLD
jgi:hypothetical protein